MTFRFSKTDLGSIVLRVQPPSKPRLMAKREVFERDLILSAKSKPKLQVISQLEVPPIRRRFNFLESGAFAAAGLIILLLIQSAAYFSKTADDSREILGYSTSAYQELNAASEELTSKDFDSAFQSFTSAQENLLRAQEKLSQHSVLGGIVPQALSAQNVLKGAYLLSSAGMNLSEGLRLFERLEVSDQGVVTENFNAVLLEHNLRLQNALRLLEQASTHFEKASALPGEYQSVVTEAEAQVAKLRSILTQLTSLEDLYLSLFGQGPKTYLLVFQNYDEARATGGFIGTYGNLKVDGGKIKKLKVASIYDLDGSMTENIAAPGPLQPDIQKWGIRDANWFVDFEQSAKKLLYFYEKTSETADGVIALTPKLFEEILKLTGPINMAQYAVTLTADNFQNVVQMKTSKEYDKELNQPKRFLSDFAPILLERFSDFKQDDWLDLFQILNDNMKSRQVLLYSRDEQTQRKIESLGFAGKVIQTDGDYLMLVNSNLSGTKTDLDIDTKVKFVSTLLSDNTVVNQLSITRMNTANERNLNYLRVLVPQGSEIVSVSGASELPHLPSTAANFRSDSDLLDWDQGELKWNKVFVRKEAGKTEFAVWSEIPPQAESELNFVYILPFKVKLSYDMLIQKQPGSIPLKFIHEMRLNGVMPVWTSDRVSVSEGSLKYSSLSDRDDYWAAVLSHD